MSPVRIAVVGAGLIGRKHIEVLLGGDGDFTLAGVADPSQEAAEAGAAAGYPVYPAIEALLAAERPDGAVVATPNQLHEAHGKACIAAGVPVLVEKPVADALLAAIGLVEAAEAAGVPALVGHHRRHNPILKRAKALIDSGAIGRAVAATSIWLLHKPAGYHDLDWRRRPGGGPVLINAIHEIDSLRMLLGEIESVQAADSRAVRGFEVEDTAAAVLRFRSGALGTLLLSDTAVSPWAWETTSGENPAFPKAEADNLFIAGTEGSLAIPSLTLNRQDAGAQSWLAPIMSERVRVAPADPYVEQMRHFRAVIRGEETPAPSLRDGLMTLAATLAITEAARIGGALRTDDLLAGRGS